MQTRDKFLLVDAGHAVLSALSPPAQTYAVKALTKRGVQVRLGTSVKEVGGGHVMLSDGTKIPTHTVIWVGGLKAASLSNNVGVKAGRGGRIDVQADLTVPGLTVFMPWETSPISRARTANHCPSLPLWQNSPTSAALRISCPRLRESMAMIGRNSGVAEVGEHRHELQGTIAFAAWLGVHAVQLPSTRARIEAFLEWAWDYFGMARGNAILDHREELQINWNDDRQDRASAASAASTQVDKAS